ncbi:MAG: Gfo/Idh/MocA family oxidoreductase [Pseudomonadota bacterium]
MSAPRVGFLGTGRIGLHRMEAMLQTGAVAAAAICDPSPHCAAEAQALAPGTAIMPSLDAMLEAGLDGLVIATPSALHARQSIAALKRGIAVFCQKPLGRDAQETAAVVAAAKAADRLLAVDFSYRYTAGMEAIARLVRGGDLGRIFAADLVFHNAYGPDKPWFNDKAQSGGGCVMDLGIHLIDLLFWLLDFPEITGVAANLLAGGMPADRDSVEDYAVAQLTLADGAVARLACSWRLQAGQDAVIEATFHGEHGGASFRNVGGSFFDFEALRLKGTATEPLAVPPDDWGGRAAAAWARQLAQSRKFDPAAEKLVDVARALDRIYAAGGV